MESSNFVIDVTAGNFAEAVVETSTRVPVLLDFWAPWCGPCRMLLPVVTKLAEEYAGEFLLAKVNIDEQQELANRFGVRSVPTVKLVRNGEVVDEFLGAQPESAIREFLDRHVEKEADRAIAAAAALRDMGDVEGAKKLLDEAAIAEPQDSKIAIAQIELMVASGHYSEAREVIESLPVRQGTIPVIAVLTARLDFLQTAEKAPPKEELHSRISVNPRDSEARYQMAALNVRAGDYEAAMDQLLEIVRRDRAYGNDAGRTALLKLFELSGDSELVSRYRGLMFKAMH